MTKLLFTILFLTFTFTAHAQETQPTPEPKVEILASTADKCADCFVERKALRNEVEVKTKAIEDLKAEIVKLQLDLSKLTGEKNGSDAMVIRLSAMVDFLLRNGRVKKYGIINF